MICPVCKNEYREGFTKCADCGVDLVEKLEEIKEEDLLFADKEMIKEQLLSEEELPEGLFDEEELAALRAMYERPAVPQYVSPIDAAKDQLSSAGVLLVVGIVGIIIILLSYFGVIDLPFGKMTTIIFYVVMGTLFAVFVIFGIVAFKKYKSIMKDAHEILEKENEITEWCLLHIRKDTIIVDETDIPEEMLYFKRTEIMREMIKAEFPDIDESYQEYIIDQIYTKVFE